MNISHVLNSLLSQPVVWHWGWTLIHFLWQGMVIVLIVGALLRMLSTRSAEVRYLVASGGLVVMLLCLPATFLLIQDKPPEVSESGSSIENSLVSGSMADRADVVLSETVGPTIHLDESVATTFSKSHSLTEFLPWTAVVWGLGVVVSCVWHLAALLRIRRLTSKKRLGKVSPDLQGRFEHHRRRLGIARRAVLVASSKVAVPCVIGVIRPVVLLPVSAMTGLSPSQLEAMLVHELVHIRRHDFLVNILQSLIEIVLFYHPAVWWLGRRIRLEREHCCDDEVVTVLKDPAGYAEALMSLELSRQQIPNPALAADGGSTGGLRERIERILGPAPPGNSLALGATAVLTLGCLFALVLVILPLAIRAQDHDEPTGPDESATRSETAGRADSEVDYQDVRSRYLRLSIEIAELERSNDSSLDLATKLAELKSLRSVLRAAESDHRKARIEELTNWITELSELKGDALIRRAAKMWPEDAEPTRILAEYTKNKLAMRALLDQGRGEKHPAVVTLSKKMAYQQDTLLESVADLQKDLLSKQEAIRNAQHAGSEIPTGKIAAPSQRLRSLRERIRERGDELIASGLGSNHPRILHMEKELNGLLQDEDGFIEELAAGGKIPEKCHEYYFLYCDLYLELIDTMATGHGKQHPKVVELTRRIEDVRKELLSKLDAAQKHMGNVNPRLNRFNSTKRGFISMSPGDWTSSGLLPAGAEVTDAASELQIKLRQKLVALQEASLQGLEASFAAGRASAEDVVDAEIEVLNARLALATAQKDHPSSLQMLAKTVSLRERQVTMTEKRFATSDTGRNDVLAARVKLLEARIALEKAKAEQGSER